VTAEPTGDTHGAVGERWPAGGGGPTAEARRRAFARGFSRPWQERAAGEKSSGQYRPLLPRILVRQDGGSISTAHSQTAAGAIAVAGCFGSGLGRRVTRKSASPPRRLARPRRCREGSHRKNRFCRSVGSPPRADTGYVRHALPARRWVDGRGSSSAASSRRGTVEGPCGSGVAGRLTDQRGLSTHTHHGAGYMFRSWFAAGRG